MRSSSAKDIPLQIYEPDRGPRLYEDTRHIVGMSVCWSAALQKDGYHTPLVGHPIIASRLDRKPIVLRARRTAEAWVRVFKARRVQWWCYIPQAPKLRGDYPVPKGQNVVALKVLGHFRWWGGCAIERSKRRR